MSLEYAQPKVHKEISTQPLTLLRNHIKLYPIQAHNMEHENDKISKFYLLLSFQFLSAQYAIKVL